MTTRTLKKTGFIGVLIAAGSAAAGAQTCIRATSTVNVRTGPGLGYAILDQNHEGDRYVALSKTGDWWKIWFDGRTAYTHDDYYTTVAGATGVKIVSGEMNVRSGPGTGYAIVGKAYAGQIYALAGTSGAWNRVWFDGTTRWIYGGGCTKVTLGSTSSTTSTVRVTELDRSPTWWYKQETNYFCGPATVKMVVKYVTGRILSQWSLAREMGTSSNGGTRISETLQAVRKHTGQGYQFHAFSRRVLAYNISHNRPCPIAFDCRYIGYAVNRDGRHSTAKHISPVSGFTSGGFLIYDSMWGDRRDRRDFCKMPARYATDTELYNATRVFGSYATIVRFNP